MENPRSPSTAEMNEIFTQACKEQSSGNLTEAKRKYLRLLEIVPKAPILLYNLGLVYFAQEAFSEAEKAFAQALVYAPQDLDILFNLALSQKRNGNINKAITSYKTLLTMDPESVDTLYNLGGCYKESSLYHDAVEMYLKVLAHDTDHIAAHNNVAYVYQCLGKTDRAIHHYKRVLELKPEHVGANHMLSALTGRACNSSPDSYVKEVFDGYSDLYEQSLVHELHYCVPAEIFRLYKELSWHKSPFSHGLDLGCGTGLGGEKFVGEVIQLDGVDLSEKMIELAGAKKIYHDLEVENIVQYLQKSTSSYDFYLAADVLGYVGDLLELFSLIGKRSTADALFCFSTETSVSEDYILQTTGRFAHKPEYICNVAAETGWSLVASSSTKLRKERGEWVHGMLWFLAAQK